jgi:type IV pilus assembly protein PilF
VRAEVYLRAALAKNPAFGPALLQMADVTYDGGNYLQSRAFLERYTSVPTSAPSPSVLWLGVRIETALGDERAAGRYAVKLKSDFPESREAGLLLAQERNAG